jgi:hypothetical protein
MKPLSLIQLSFTFPQDLVHQGLVFPYSRLLVIRESPAVGDPQHHPRSQGGKSSDAGSPQAQHPTIRELESPMSARGFSLVLGAAAGAFLAAGLIPLATSAVARADGDDGMGSAAADPGFVSSTTDPGFISSTENFGLFTDIAAADPGDNEFVANFIEGPMVKGSPLFEDVLTSGADPGDGLASLGAPDDLGVGMAGETINTFIVPSDPMLDFTTMLGFTDPLASVFTELIQLGLI